MMTLEQVKYELKNYDGEKVKIMEVCGTHTSSIFKNGIRSLLSPKIELISGPGCPVCVTEEAYIDKLVDYSMTDNYHVLTFGDMMKVKGSKYSLSGAKAMGGKVSILYSPLGAINLARENTNITYIFAAVGFETTAPSYALLLEEVKKYELTNIKILTSLKTMLPALTYICDNEEHIDAFLCPGHVSVITGFHIYDELTNKYKKPFVVAGFEGEHILAAVYEILKQFRNNKYSTANLYKSAVSENGNEMAAALVNKYFETSDGYWRGIGLIKASGLKLREEYKDFDGGSDLISINSQMPKSCKCKEVILGRIQPIECPLFRSVCTPMNAIGPCMVSTEGACGIWYKNGANVNN